MMKAFLLLLFFVWAQVSFASDCRPLLIASPIGFSENLEKAMDLAKKDKAFDSVVIDFQDTPLSAKNSKSLNGQYYLTTDGQYLTQFEGVQEVLTLRDRKGKLLSKGKSYRKKRVVKGDAVYFGENRVIYQRTDVKNWKYWLEELSLGPKLREPKRNEFVTEFLEKNKLDIDAFSERTLAGPNVLVFGWDIKNKKRHSFQAAAASNGRVYPFEAFPFNDVSMSMEQMHTGGPGSVFVLTLRKKNPSRAWRGQLVGTILKKRKWQKLGKGGNWETINPGGKYQFESYDAIVIERDIYVAYIGTPPGKGYQSSLKVKKWSPEKNQWYDLTPQPQGIAFNSATYKGKPKWIYSQGRVFLSWIEGTTRVGYPASEIKSGLINKYSKARLKRIKVPSRNLFLVEMKNDQFVDVVSSRSKRRGVIAEPTSIEYYHISSCPSSVTNSLARVEKKPLHHDKPIAVSVPSQRDVQKVISAMKSLGLCGEYKTSQGLYTSLTFDGSEIVRIDASGLIRSNPYWVEGSHIKIRTDKAVFSLKVEANGSLVGEDKWTKGSTYVKSSAKKTKCAKQISYKNLQHELCYAKGVNLQSQRKITAAKQQHIACCGIDDALSCNKAGFLVELVDSKRELAKTYYQKACRLGYGGGCSNLAAYYQKKSDLKKAKELFKKACEMKFYDACSRLYDLD